MPKVGLPIFDEIGSMVDQSFSCREDTKKYR